MTGESFLTRPRGRTVEEEMQYYRIKPHQVLEALEMAPAGFEIGAERHRPGQVNFPHLHVVFPPFDSPACGRRGLNLVYQLNLPPTCRLCIWALLQMRDAQQSSPAAAPPGLVRSLWKGVTRR